MEAQLVALTVVIVAFCSLLAVAAWSASRRKEREAFFRSEAIKKLAEMQSPPTEAVLELLREALVPKASPPLHPIAARAYYRSEMLKRIAEIQGSGSDAVLAFLREEQTNAARRQREGMKLGGLICGAVGVGLWIFLRAMPIEQPVYLAGLIPGLVGAALWGYAYFLAPAE